MAFAPAARANHAQRQGFAPTWLACLNAIDGWLPRLDAHCWRQGREHLSWPGSRRGTHRIMTDHPQNPEAISSPEVAAIVAADFLGGQKLEDGIGLCLSGGGFRAMLFHLGAFIRLNEVGLLAKLDRVASVSGGSIAAGALAVAWSNLTFDASGLATNFLEEVAAPLLALARKQIDTT